MSSRIVAENVIDAMTSYFNPTELSDLTRCPAAGNMPMLRQLLKHVGDLQKEAIGDGSETSMHHALDIAGIEPRPLLFVLSFSNLSYDIKVRRKMSLSSVFAAAVAEAPTFGESVFKRTKTLLDGISGETCNGEIMAILDASNSGKSTLNGLRLTT